MSFASLMNAAGLVPPAVPAAPWGAGGSPPMPTSVTPGFTDNFPVLTEEVGYPPSPLAASGGGGSKQGSNGRGTSMGPMVTRALQDALGWKIKPGDSAGFMGALNQSFQLSLVEGHVASKWTPRSYAVQSDLSGGITGAQASVYTMAKTLVDQMLPLINGLYALDPAADQEYVTALKQLATDQLTNLCQEIGYLGGPRVMRVHQYFQMLMGGTCGSQPRRTTADCANRSAAAAAAAAEPVDPTAVYRAADTVSASAQLLYQPGHDLRHARRYARRTRVAAARTGRGELHQHSRRRNQRDELPHRRRLCEFAVERLGQQHPVLRHHSHPVPGHATGHHLAPTRRHQRGGERGAFRPRLGVHRPVGAADDCAEPRIAGGLGSAARPTRAHAIFRAVRQRAADLPGRPAVVDAKIRRRRSAGHHPIGRQVRPRRGVLRHDLAVVAADLGHLVFRANRGRASRAQYFAGSDLDAEAGRSSSTNCTRSPTRSARPTCGRGLNRIGTETQPWQA